MAADAFSSILGWLVMGTGNDNNSWGDNWNLSVGIVLEKSIAGRAVHAVTGGTLDLSGSPPPAAVTQVVEMMHVFTGVLGSTQNVIVPDLSKVFIIDNRTTGGFGLLMKPSGGTYINIPQGKMTIVITDGSAGIVRHDRENVGKGNVVFGTTVPGGEFEIDGSTKLIADYPDLYARIGTTYGGNGITTFALPDGKTAGRFLRSRTGSVAAGTLQDADLAPHNHAASASTSVSASGTTDTQGSHSHSGGTGAESGNHTHNYGNAATGGQVGGASAGGSSGNIWYGSTTGTTGVENQTHNHSIIVDGAHAHNLSISASGSTSVTVSNSTGTETRPTNISVLMTIAY